MRNVPPDFMHRRILSLQAQTTLNIQANLTSSSREAANVASTDSSHYMTLLWRKASEWGRKRGEKKKQRQFLENSGDHDRKGFVNLHRNFRLLRTFIRIRSQNSSYEEADAVTPSPCRKPNPLINFFLEHDIFHFIVLFAWFGLHPFYHAMPRDS